ncbi:hypothetical protein ACHAXR_001986 [Thalassiosira sp. AJA248-18]
MLSKENSNTERICPFCREPEHTSNAELIKRMEKRVEAGDAFAMHALGGQYQRGIGVPQDSNKALELWHRAAKLGCAQSHGKIATVYIHGEGVETDGERAEYHFELAAMQGSVIARHNLGGFETSTGGNMNRAMKHFMIAAEYGCDKSLERIKNGFFDGHVTKDEFERALRAHKESKDEMQSDQRDASQRYVMIRAMQYNNTKYDQRDAAPR